MKNFTYGTFNIFYHKQEEFETKLVCQTSKDIMNII